MTRWISLQYMTILDNTNTNVNICKVGDLAAKRGRIWAVVMMLPRSPPLTNTSWQQWIRTWIHPIKMHTGFTNLTLHIIWSSCSSFARVSRPLQDQQRASSVWRTGAASYSMPWAGQFLQRCLSLSRAVPSHQDTLWMAGANWSWMEHLAVYYHISCSIPFCTVLFTCINNNTRCYHHRFTQQQQMQMTELWHNYCIHTRKRAIFQTLHSQQKHPLLRVQSSLQVTTH